MHFYKASCIYSPHVYSLCLSNVTLMRCPTVADFFFFLSASLILADYFRHVSVKLLWKPYCTHTGQLLDCECVARGKCWPSPFAVCN